MSTKKYGNVLCKGNGTTVADLGTDDDGYSLFLDMGNTRDQKSIIAEGAAWPQVNGGDIIIELYFSYHDDAIKTPCFSDAEQGLVATMTRCSRIILFEAVAGIKYGVRVLDQDGETAIANTVFDNFDLSII